VAAQVVQVETMLEELVVQEAAEVLEELEL
jgi:hypothetical protein